MSQAVTRGVELELQRTEISDGALRQRRNLILTSSFLIIRAFVGIELTTTLTVQGLTFLLKNPSRVNDVLVVLNLYFTWRFYQYAVADNWFNKLKAQFMHQFGLKASKLVYNEIKRLNPTLKSFGGKFGYQYFKRHSCTKYQIDISPLETFEGGNIESGNFLVSRIKVEMLRIPLAIVFVFREKVVSDYVLPILYSAVGTYVYYVTSVST